MQEMIDCLTEEVKRYSGLAALTEAEPFKSDYQRKADLLAKAAEILKKIAKSNGRNKNSRLPRT